MKTFLPLEISHKTLPTVSKTTDKTVSEGKGENEVPTNTFERVRKPGALSTITTQLQKLAAKVNPIPARPRTIDVEAVGAGDEGYYDLTHDEAKIESFSNAGTFIGAVVGGVGALAASLTIGALAFSKTSGAFAEKGHTNSALGVPMLSTFWLQGIGGALVGCAVGRVIGRSAAWLAGYHE